MRDRAALDARALFDHALLGLSLGATLTLRNILVQFAAEKQNIFGAEAVSSSVDATSVGVRVGIFFFDRGDNTVQDWEDFLGRVTSQPHVDGERLGYTCNAKLDLLDDGGA